MFGAMIRIQEYECCVEVSGYCGCESPQDRNGDDGLIDLNIPEAILKKKSKKKCFFFFFPESDWISAISSSYSQEMICLFLQCLRCLQKQLKSFISSSREPGLMTTSPLAPLKLTALPLSRPPVSLQYWRTMTSGSYGCCPRTRPSVPTSGVLMWVPHTALPSRTLPRIKQHEGGVLQEGPATFPEVQSPQGTNRLV